MHRPLIAVIALGVIAAPAQAPSRVPVIAGNGLLRVLVEIDGTVKTWGSPASLDRTPGLGDGTRPGPEVKEPRALPGVRGISDAAVGPTHVLLLKRDGTVLAWGDNDDCEVGSGDSKTKLAPIPVAGLKNVTQISAGGGVSAALDADGSVWTWGSGLLLANGRSGRDVPCTAVPAKVDGLTSVRQLSIGGNSALALKDDGTVWGWGTNDSGELCDGTTERRPRPIQMSGLASVSSIVMGENSLFVLADGTVRMCGKNEDGALGEPSAKTTVHHTPFQVPGLTGVRSARMNGNTTIVQLADGSLRAWGLGWYGALGDGHGDTFSARPKAPIGVGPVAAYYMETNGSAAYAIRADGTVMVWGIPAPPGGKTTFILTPVPASFSVKMSE